MKKFLTTALVAGTALAAIAAAPASPDADVTVDGDTVTIAGTLAEAMGEYVIGTDPVGDSTFNGLGGDFSGMSVAFPEPGIVQYRVQIGDPNPATGIMPHGLRVDVEGITIGSTTLDINASSMADTGVTVGTTTCEEGPGGVTNCSTSAVEGGYEDGAIIWNLPVPTLPGDSVTGATAVAKLSISTGTTGGVYLNTAMDQVGISALGVVPSATILVDGVAAGSATLTDFGFEVSASDLTDGEHTIALELCGPDADFSGNATACEVLDLGTVTIGDVA